MYKTILRPLLFLFRPETAHKITFRLLKVSKFIPFVPYFRKCSSVNYHPALTREVFGLKFKNPVGLAAGLDKNAEVFNELSDSGFGFIEIGTVTPMPQKGNPKPRLFRIVSDHALVNRMGFNNHGVKKAVQNLKKNKKKVIIGGNIGKNTATSNDDAINDYVFCFNALFDYVDYFVVNVSCPNIKDLQKLQDKKSLITILGELKAISKTKAAVKPILLKISPDLTEGQLDEIVEVVLKTSIDGIVATNTTTSRDGLSLTRDEIEKIGSGGLSGKPLSGKSTDVIRYLVTKLGNDFPVIASGGIMSVEDAMEKFNAGAKLVQLYTGFVYEGPGLVRKVNRALLEQYAKH